MFVQTNLYEFINLNDDPVFKKIKNLNIGNEVQIDNYTIRKNEKFYEIENDELHEGFDSIEKCYSFISSNL